MAMDGARLAAALPGYDIGEELGRGAFGVVVAGVQRALGRHVAIKALPANLAGDEGLRLRFNAEARLVASFDHPHVVRVFDYVEQDDLFLLVMELLSGGTLGDRMDARALTPQEACAVALSVAGALHYAHQRGILHRDVKPANVMFAADGTAKLGDFGIAKVLESGAGLTATGSIMGTPAFMAPEQATGSELGPPTDVYAAGIVLYQMLAGCLPFDGAGEVIAQLYQHVNQAPRPLREAAPDVPEALVVVVHRALEKDPNDRYATAEDLGLAVAEAAAAALGPGWLRDAGIPVLTSGSLAAAPPTVTPDPHATVTTRTVAPAGAVTPSAPGRWAESPSPELPVTRPSPTEPPPPATRKRRAVTIAVVVLVLVGVGLGIAMLLDGGDDGNRGEGTSRDEATTSTPAPGATSTSVATLSRAALDRFTRECEDFQVAPEDCRCIADAAVSAGLAPEPFDAAVDRIVEDGVLINGLEELFEQCATA